MDNKQHGFAFDAEEIRESGRWSAINRKIESLCAKPVSGNEWQVQLFGGLCFQVLREYQNLHYAYAIPNSEPSLLAWRARNLLELSVWSVFFAMNRDNALKLYKDAGRDVKNILDGFEKWGQTNGPQESWLGQIANARIELELRAAAEGINDLEKPFMRVAKAAVECGLTGYPTMNKFLSKFVHPTAMQILDVIDNRRKALQRGRFYEIGCCSFLGAFNALEGSVARIEQDTIAS